MPQWRVQNQLQLFLYIYWASGKFHRSREIWSYPSEKNSRFLSFAGTEIETEDLNIQTVDRKDTYVTAWLALMYCITAFVFQRFGGWGDEVDSSVVLPQPQCLVYECFESLYLYSWPKRQPTAAGAFHLHWRIPHEAHVNPEWLKFGMCLLLELNVLYLRRAYFNTLPAVTINRDNSVGSGW